MWLRHTRGHVHVSPVPSCTEIWVCTGLDLLETDIPDSEWKEYLCCMYCLKLSIPTLVILWCLEAFSIVSLSRFSSPCSQSCCSSIHRGLDITQEFCSRVCTLPLLLAFHSCLFGTALVWQISLVSISSTIFLHFQNPLASNSFLPPPTHSSFSGKHILTWCKKKKKLSIVILKIHLIATTSEAAHNMSLLFSVRPWLSVWYKL